MEITIQEKTYTIKYSIRSLFVFEQLTGKVFKLETLTDTYIFFYSMLLSGNTDCTLSFDEFIDECESQPDLLSDFQNYLTKVFSNQKQFVKEDDSKKK